MNNATYGDHGIRFEYPEGWELEETEGDAVVTVAVHAPDGLAFALVTVDGNRPDPAVLADLAVQTMRDEYPALDVIPALESIAGHSAIGHDVEFISLDLTNGCAIRAFRTARRTVLLFNQWSDIEDESTAELLTALRRSVSETDA